MVQFGLFLPAFAEFSDPAAVASLAETAEEAGWDGFFLWDHILALPGMGVADPWVSLAGAASATSRIRLGALVTPLPRRRPWVLARQLSTLDHLSEGRLVGGVGIGDDGWGEFASFGDEVDPAVRGQMTDEALVVLRGFLAGEAVSYAGRYYTVDAPPLLPPPRQQPFPVWGACRWPHQRALRRAATLEGCFPIFDALGPPGPPDPERLIGIRSNLLDHGASRDIDLVVRFSLSRQAAGPLQDALEALAAAGVTWVLDSFGPGEPPARVVEAAVRRGPPAFEGPRRHNGIR